MTSSPSCVGPLLHAFAGAFLFMCAYTGCLCGCTAARQLWEGDEDDKKELQKFLVKQLGLDFVAEPPMPSNVPRPSSQQGSKAQPAAPDTPQLPNQLDADHYSSAAFQGHVTKRMNAGFGPMDHYDPSAWLEVLADESVQWERRITLLQDGQVEPAVIPSGLLLQLVQTWVCLPGDKGSRAASHWVTSRWGQFTAEQAMALRPVLPGPAFGSNPDMDRPYMAALSTKALAGAAGTAGAGDSQGCQPWSVGASDVAAAQDLQCSLAMCDELGPPADWIRLHVLHAQLELQQKQQPAVDMQLLVDYLRLLGRATWTKAPTFSSSSTPTSQQQHQQPLHVACSVCGMQPIVGARFRSTTKHGFNACAGCAGSSQAQQAWPLEKVAIDDTIYMLPSASLPRVLGSMSAIEAQREQEARCWLLELVQQDGADGGPERFTSAGPCPLAAGGLLLPPDWRDKVVAEGKLLSGRGDTTAWSRLYQQAHGDISELHDRIELGFAAHNRSAYSLSEDVVLHLHTKNAGVQGVLVKVFEINCWNYYTAEGTEVDLNLELSGVAPSKTLHIKTPEDPIIRSLHSIPLELSGAAGVWLVEVVAAGKRARARLVKSALHITQRITAAGQVLTVTDENWRPVEDVRVWCEGQGYANKQDSKTTACNEVLLPYGRKQHLTPLVIAATLPGAPTAAAAAPTTPTTAAQRNKHPIAGGKQDSVTLFQDFIRLQEQYTLYGQLYCHPESLISGQTVPLLLQLALRIHGVPGALQLLQDVQLSVTATSADGGDVTRVFKDLIVDPHTCELVLHYTLPAQATRLAASLSAKLLLALPGVNGEPDWQQFYLNELMQGPSGRLLSVPIQTASHTSDIWDVYLTPVSSTSSGSSLGSSVAAAAGKHSSQTPGSSAAASPVHQQTQQPSDRHEYALQVLGRAGEAPTVPKIIRIWLSHVNFSVQHPLRFRLQTGPGGVVKLGSLCGIREVKAQIESAVDYSSEQHDLTNRPGGIAAGSGQDTTARQQLEGVWCNYPEAGYVKGGSSGAVRSWRISRPSWWDNQLQPQYTMAVGGQIKLAIAAAAGQSLTACLLQLVDPAKCSNSSSCSFECAAIAADATAEHLQIISSTGSNGGSSHNVATGVGSICLGATSLATVRVQGLSAGLYRLIAPALLLQPPTAVFKQLQQARQVIHIIVLPAVSAAATEDTGGTEIDTAHAAEASGTAAPSTVSAEAAPAGDGVSGVPQNPHTWLYAAESQHTAGPAVLRPSASQQLQIMSVSCSVALGLSVQLSGTVDKLASGRVLVAFSRFMPDATMQPTDLLPGAGIGCETLEPFERFGSSGAQFCGDYGECKYSNSAKLDSAIAYVLQRRLWEEGRGALGGRRPGSLLERPSLLVQPRVVGSAASATSVLRGDDGGVLKESARPKMMKKVRQQSAYPGYSPTSPGYSAAAPGCTSLSAAYAAPSPGAPCFGVPAPVPAAYAHRGYSAALALGQQMVAPKVAQSPVLGFLKNPALVWAGLNPDQGGNLVLTAEQLQRAIAGAAGGSQDSGCSSAASSLGGAGGYTMVTVIAYVPNQPEQFSSKCCVIEGAAAPEASVMREARRDLGLNGEIDDNAVSAQTCEVLTLHAGACISLPNADAAEVAIYSSVQQLYQFLKGLVQFAERGILQFADRSVLPDLCVPPKAQGSSVSSLLRQWEPLLLDWPSLSAIARSELLSELGSAEMAFFLACRDPQAYKQMLLPLLCAKLPSELSCLEQILLLQGKHNQPSIPAQYQLAAPATNTAQSAVSNEYLAAKQALLDHWYAPHRYQKLNVLPKLLLAALEGPEALTRLGADMQQRLQTPAEKRGVKRTWMSGLRRSIFDMALLLARQHEQEQQQQRHRTHDTADDNASDSLTEAEADRSDDDYVHVSSLECGKVLSHLESQRVGGGCRPQSARFGSSDAVAACNTATERATRHDASVRAAAGTAEDLAVRQQIAAAAAMNVRRAPQETKEWAEAGWWKCEGQGAPAGLIPETQFWASFAIHLATVGPGTSFIPTEPLVASSTAAVVAALAVVGLPWEGASTSSIAQSSSQGAAGAASVLDGANTAVIGQVRPADLGCSRSYSGGSLTLTAKSPSLMWVKQVKPAATITPNTVATVTRGQSISAGAAADTPVSAATSTSMAAEGNLHGSSMGSLIVIQRLFDPRHASTVDPETGEEMLVALQPSEQQPLLAGQRYCCSVVITSMAAGEQQLDIITQVPQGALPLMGGPSTTSFSVSLQPHATQQFTSTFYFPEPGLYKQAPVSVTKRGRPAWLPASTPTLIHVAAAPVDNAGSVQQTSTATAAAPFSWTKFIASASPSDVLNYLETGDLTAARLADLSPYCRDLRFYTAATSALSKRHVLDHGIWKWAVHHMDGQGLQQLLPLSQVAAKLLQWKLPVSGVWLLQLSEVDAGLWHLEYWPWVNPYCRPIPRAFGDPTLPSALSDNPSMAQQWRRFLLALLFDFTATAEASKLTTTMASNVTTGTSGVAESAATATSSSSTGLQGGSSSGSKSSMLSLQKAAAAACYLLLQDRVDEAEWVLDQVHWQQAAAQLANDAPMRMQAEYLRVWLALSKPLQPAKSGTVPVQVADVLSLARATTNRYRNHPVTHWRKKFAALEGVLTELEQYNTAAATGATVQQHAVPGSTAHSDSAAATVGVDNSMLSITITDGRYLHVQYRQLTDIHLSAYQIDTELLFTTQPFSALTSYSSSSGGITGKLAGNNAFGSSKRASDTPPSGTQEGGSDDLGKVAYVQPTRKMRLQLSEHGATTSGAAAASGQAAGGSAEVGGDGVTSAVFDLDALLPDLASRSVLLEIAGGGITRTLPRFASRLVMHVLEAQGLLQACYMPQPPQPQLPGVPGRQQLDSSSISTQQQQQQHRPTHQHASGQLQADYRLLPAAAVYVKVFAQDDTGSEWFHKDGYTDLRGKFDYVNLTSIGGSKVMRYSLLVASPELGAVMMQAAPPPTQ
eukprot:GHRR01002308.1.p1 GENE.GHRR01002308.1~~GHRR01002308.1.p1  ORF type:complete len:2960 (+),score=1151.97 GHRR01002308.1:374-9253(+)